MENEERNLLCESFPMNAGDGPYSYTRNSSVQEKGLKCAKAIINEAIAENLDVIRLFSHPSNSFNIADLGCSVGPNTIFVVQNIIESVKLKYQTQETDTEIPEFQVFFNDHISNDFNTLFKSLPFEKQYYAAGVPGSFYGRLFPKASLHFVHSSYALQWLSKVPKEVVDKGSPAWNKGRIYCSNAPKEVSEAYESQFAKDMESFLNARSIELVHGGLMAILIPTLPPCSKCILIASFDLLGSALMDMAYMDLLNEAQVDSFNLPIYIPTQQELEALIERNGHFSIERKDTLDHSLTDDSLPCVEMVILHFRAACEGLIREHFGSEIIEELFNRFKEKLVESTVLSDSSYKPMVELLVTLKLKFEPNSSSPVISKCI